MAEQIVGGIAALCRGVVEAWDELPPKERAELYLKVKEEARRLARKGVEDRIAQRFGVRFDK